MLNSFLQSCQRTVFTKLWERYTFLSYVDVDLLTKSLCDDVIDSDEEFDMVVSVDSGGRYVANTISRRLSLPVDGIKVDKYAVTILGVDLDDVVGAYRISKALGANSSVRVSNNLAIETVEDKSVLLIDDDTFSGDSLNTAIHSLEKQNPKNIKTAVLYQFGSRSSVDYVAKRISTEQYYETRPVMPWIKFSPHYNQ